MTLTNRLLTGLIFGCLCSSAALAQATAPAAPSSAGDDGSGQVLDTIVAVVNDDIITLSGLERGIRLAEAQLRDRGITPPPPSAIQSQVLEQLITMRIQVQRAESAGIKVTDPELNRAMESVASQNKMTLPQFEAALKKDGIGLDEVRKQIKDQIMIQQLRQKEVDQRITVTDQDVDLFLANQHDRDQKTEYRLSHILVSVPEDASEKVRAAAKAQADDLLKQLRNGGNFAQIAIAHSDSPTALQGGDLGWRKDGDLPTMFASVVPSMKVDQISDVIPGSNGYNIIELTGKRDNNKHESVEETHAEHILLAPNDLRDDAATKALAEQIYQKLRNGADFATLAKQYSDDTGSKNNGGDLGWQMPGSFVPEFQKVVDGLQPGQMSAPFQTQFGWHIVKVLGRRSRDVTDDMRRGQARQAIMRRREDQDYQSWLRRLRDEAYIDIRLKPGMITDADVDNGSS